MKIFCTQWDSNWVPYTYEAKALSIALLDLIHVHIEHLKVDHILPVSALKIYLYHVEDVVKCFVMHYILLTPYSQQMS